MSLPPVLESVTQFLKVCKESLIFFKEQLLFQFYLDFPQREAQPPLSFLEMTTVLSFLCSTLKLRKLQVRICVFRTRLVNSRTGIMSRSAGTVISIFTISNSFFMVLKYAFLRSAWITLFKFHSPWIDFAQKLNQMPFLTLSVFYISESFTGRNFKFLDMKMLKFSTCFLTQLWLLSCSIDCASSFDLLASVFFRIKGVTHQWHSFTLLSGSFAQRL